MIERIAHIASMIFRANVQHAILVGEVDLAAGAVLAIMVLVLYVILRKYCNNRCISIGGILSDENASSMLILILLLVIASIALIGSGYLHVANPEYYAVQYIIHAFK